jgi:hypothetical protein
VAFVWKAADEIRIMIFFKSFGVQRTNDRIITSNKVTNNFAVLVTSGIGPDVARGSLIGLRSLMKMMIMSME